MKLFLSKIEKQEKEYWKRTYNIDLPNYLLDKDFIEGIDPYEKDRLLKQFVDNGASEKDFKNFMKLYKNNKALTEKLIPLYYRKSEVFTEDFINKYGENFLLNYSDLMFLFEKSDIYANKGSLEDIVPVLKSREYNIEEKNLIANNHREILELLEKGVNIEVILNNKTQFNEIYNDFRILRTGSDENNKISENTFSQNLNSLNGEEIQKYLTNISLFKEFKNKYRQKIADTDPINYIDIRDYLISNPNAVFPYSQIEKYVKEYYEEYNNMKLIDLFSYNNDIPTDFKDNFLLDKIKKTTDLSKLKQYALAYSLHINFFNDYNLENIMKTMSNNNFEVSENTKSYIQIFNSIDSANSKEELLGLIDNKYSDFKSEVISCATSYISKDIGEGLFNPNDLVESENVKFSYETLQDGNQIKYITLKDVPFITLTHNIVDWKNNALQSMQPTSHLLAINKDLPNNPQLWTEQNDEGTNYIAMSLNSQNSFATFVAQNTPLTLGFSSVRDKQIKKVFTSDGGTPTSSGTELKQSLRYPGKSKLLKVGKTRYNEVDSERDGVLPDYLLVADSKTNSGISWTLDDNTKKWAAEYGIPIVKIDSQSYVNGAYQRYSTALEYIKTKEELPTKEELDILDGMRKAIDTFAPNGYHAVSKYDMVISSLNLQNKVINDEDMAYLGEILNDDYLEISNFSTNEYKKLNNDNPDLKGHTIGLKTLGEEQRHQQLQNMYQNINANTQQNNISQDTGMSRMGISSTMYLLIIGIVFILAIILSVCFILIK